jgi:hypothetical protein
LCQLLNSSHILVLFPTISLAVGPHSYLLYYPILLTLSLALTNYIDHIAVP